MTGGAVIPLRRGRILLPVRADVLPAPGHEAAAGAGDRFKVALLVALLPLFGQSFHYLIDLAPTYLLSKAWPFVTLPLALLGLMRAAPPMTVLFLTMLAYVLGVTPLLSMVHLGNGFLDALATTVKAWPLAYYFSLTGLLALALPKPAAIQRALVLLGIATFGLMIVLWFAVPRSWYVTDVALSKFFIFETERGYRLYMPMFLGTLALFLCARYAMATPGRRWLLLLIPLAMLAQVLIYKQRVVIAGTAAIVGLGILAMMPSRLRLLGIIGALVVGAVGLFVLVSGVLTAGLDQSLGNSLSIRQNSFALAIEYVAQDLLRLVFGVGSVTRHSAVTMADLFGDARFYLADIGWAGILFEYGAIGTGLIAAVHAGAAVITWRNARLLGDPLSAALFDYVLYIILTSSIYSVMFLPGELATVTALSVYLVRYRNGALPSA